MTDANRAAAMEHETLIQRVKDAMADAWAIEVSDGETADEAYQALAIAAVEAMDEERDALTERLTAAGMLVDEWRSEARTMPDGGGCGAVAAVTLQRCANRLEKAVAADQPAGGRAR